MTLVETREGRALRNPVNRIKNMGEKKVEPEVLTRHQEQHCVNSPIGNGACLTT